MVREPNGGFGLLEPYRVLDLTDERGLLCGKILADLGADVLQIEPPGGSPARNLGPFHGDDVHPEKSLFWWAYTGNKRGITLDVNTADGKALFLRLAQSADFVLESFAPGYLGSLGLGYPDLSLINPKLVMVSISPFGQDGPYSQYKAPDIVGMAMGGFMYLTGDGDRPPVRVGFPHFYLHGAAAGAAGAMLAHTHRASTGVGQHVDVSCQQAVAKTLAHAPQTWDLERVVIKRMGVFRQTAGDTAVRINWKCQDGYVNYMLQGGGVATSTRALLAWMDEEGLGDEYLESVNWEDLGYGNVRSEVMSRAAGPLDRFFSNHTRAELAGESVKRRILLFPVATPHDILRHPQLEARHYFQEVEHPDLEGEVTYPGAFVRYQPDGGARPLGRPPRIGEHIREIFGKELGLSGEQLTALRSNGVI